MMEQYSVLMSVYEKENPEFIKQSIDSMLFQTVLPADFVIVCDGPLTSEIYSLIDSYTEKYPDLFSIIKLKQNVGIGGAANEGIKHCKFDIIAKMDSDDIAVPTRCETQIQIMSENDVDIIGGWISEFYDSTENSHSIRRVPESHEDIFKYAKRRMPFNNQTVMYKKAAVNKAGGYDPKRRRCEDYDLYFRMLESGAISYNTQQVLVHYRLTPDAFRRRGTWQNFKGFTSVHWKMLRRGFCSISDFFIPFFAQLFLMILPGKLKDKFYTKLLRK